MILNMTGKTAGDSYWLYAVIISFLEALYALKVRLLINRGKSKYFQIVFFIILKFGGQFPIRLD